MFIPYSFCPLVAFYGLVPYLKIIFKSCGIQEKYNFVPLPHAHRFIDEETKPQKTRGTCLVSHPVRTRNCILLPSPTLLLEISLRKAGQFCSLMNKNSAQQMVGALKYLLYVINKSINESRLEPVFIGFMLYIILCNLFNLYHQSCTQCLVLDSTLLHDSFNSLNYLTLYLFCHQVCNIFIHLILVTA